MPLLPRLAVRRGLIVAALLAVFAMQWLGALHRVMHPAGAPHAAGHDGHALFAAHDTAADCQLFDDLAGGDVAVGAPVVPAVPPAVELPVVLHAGVRLAAQAAGFLARGPPSRS